MASPRFPAHAYSHSTQEDHLLTSGLYTDTEFQDGHEATLASIKAKSPTQHAIAAFKSQLPMVKEEKKEAFKYAEVWQRVRTKLKLRDQLKCVQDDLQLHGRNIVPLRVTSSGEVLYRDELKDRESQPQARTRCILSPTSKPKRIWSVVYFLIMAYASLITPFTVSFVREENTFPWLETNIAIDFLFFCDIIVTFNRAYEDENQHIVSSRRMIAAKYVKSWFLVDATACLPVYLLQQTYETGSWIEEYYIFRLSRLLRLFHLSSLYEFFSKSRGHYLSDLLNIRSSTFRLIAFLVSMSITTHIVACIWHLISVIENKPENWIFRMNMLDSSTTDRYISALYWAVTTLSTVGYGDIVPGTEAERLFVGCWMLFAIFFISYAVGCLAEVFDPKVTKENTMIRKLAVIDEFANEAKLSSELKSQLRDAIHISIESSDLIQTQVRDIFHKDIPIDLRYEIAQIIHHKALNSIPFFRNKEKQFVVMVFPFLGQQFAQQEMSIYCENDTAELIYFIIAGRCAVIAQEEFVLKKLWMGSYFGDIEVFMDIPRQYTVKAALPSELLTMNHHLLREIRKRFGIIFDEMESIAFAKERAWEEAKFAVNGLREKLGVAKRSLTKEHDEILKKKRKESMRLSTASLASCQRSSLGVGVEGTDSLSVLESKVKNTYQLLMNVALIMQHAGIEVEIESDDADCDSQFESEHDVYKSSSSESEEG